MTNLRDEIQRALRALDDADAGIQAVDKMPDGEAQIQRISYDALLAEAKAFDPETPPDTINEMLARALRLTHLENQRILEEIKRATKLPIGTLKREQAAIRQTDGDAPDQLSMAQEIIRDIGPENILSAESHVYAWDHKGLWQVQDDRTVKQMVQARLPQLADAVTASLVNAVSDLFQTEIHKPHHQFNVGDPETVNCPNGEVMLDDGHWYLRSHEREHYRTARVPVAFDPAATAPQFQTFLNDIFQGDPDADEKTTAILEMMGYTLMAHCKHERFIILVGSGANGKSVLLSVLESLCGSNNIAGVQPSQFGNKFQRAHLHNKLANIVTEIMHGEVIDDASLKGIVSGEATTVEEKFKDPFVMHPFCTCWFGTNHMPHTRDFSDALFRRALVIPFNQVFKPELGNCDPDLKNKLVAELPGILNLVLVAYRSAIANGFTMPQSCLDAREQWRMEADQVAQFVDEECRRVSDGEIQISALYRSYERWANDAGIQRKVTIKSFRDRLTTQGFGNHRTAAGRFVTGIALR